MGHFAILRAMVAKDLRRHARAPLAIGLILAFPLIFAGLLALAFGGGGDSASVPKVKLLIENRDDGLVGSLLVSAFSAEQAAEYFIVEQVGEEGAQRLEQGEASALLRLPTSLSNDLIARRPVTLELVRNPAQSILPEIAEQITTLLAEGLSAAAYTLDEPLAALEPLLSEQGAEVTDAGVAEIAVAVNHVMTRAGPVLFPPLITLETVSLETTSLDTAADTENDESDDDLPRTTAIFLFILPGVAVFALFSLGDHVMRDLLTEAEQGTLTRQLAAPLTAGRVVAAKAASTALLSLLSLLTLSLIAWWAGGRGVHPAGFAALAGSLILAVTGTSATLYAFARTTSQGATIGSVIYLVLGFASGSFLPLDSLPASVQSVAPYTPFYWATQGFQELILNQASVADVLPNITILAVLGGVLLLFGSLLLEKRMRQGVSA